MNNSKQRKALWELAKLIRKFAEAFTPKDYRLDDGELFRAMVFEPEAGQ